MELILINNSKLKVMLTPADMESYAITCDTIDYENTETRRAFWNILDEAKHKTGFDAASDRVFIQVYPSRNGGCEMYVTKLIHNDLNCEIDIKRVVLREIYSFCNIGDLLNVCGQLIVNGYTDDSAVYTDESNYYLVLSDTGGYSFITEYGERKITNLLEPYLTEHCKCICGGNAVGILSKL